MLLLPKIDCVIAVKYDDLFVIFSSFNINGFCISDSFNINGSNIIISF